jgi:N-acetylglucosamine malate deacetylase 1
MRVLAVGAHPDDLEVLCAGTLARYARAGHQVVMCAVARGDKGHFQISPTELSAIRRQEATSSAALIGADLIWLGQGDMELHPDDPATQTMFIDAVRQARPDVIITHHPADYMSDHTATGKLVIDASWAATIPHFETGYPAINTLPSVYFMDTILSVGFDPQEYVDITDTLATKLAMMSQHASQLTWLKEHDNLDILDLIETTAKLRGYQCGARYAEGFIPYRAGFRQVPRRELP